MSALREVLARFGVEFDSKQLDKGHASIEGTIHKLEEFGSLIAGSLIVEGVRRFIEGIVETGVELEHTSIRTGIAVDKLQELEYAAKLSGVGAESLDLALSKLGKNLAGTGEGGNEMAAAFKRAGIGTKDASGQIRTAGDVLPDIADAFTKITNPSERAALAMKIFGRGGAQLIPLLAKGREGIEQLAAEARDLGGGLSEDAVGGAVAMHQATERLDFAFLGLKSRLATAILPALTALVNGLVKGVVWIQNITKHSNVLQGMLMILGGGGLAAVLRLVGGFAGLWSILGKLLFRLVLPALIIDELITTFQGGDTIIRRVIDNLFGVGKTAQIVEELKEAWRESVQFLKDHAGVIAALTIAYGLVRVAIWAVIAGENAWKAAKLALAVVHALYNAAVSAGTFAIWLYKGATDAATLSAVAANTALLPLIATLGLAAAAVGALTAAWSQWKSLNAETEGLGITGTLGQMVKQGTINPFTAINAFQNEQARKRAGAVGPAASAAAPTTGPAVINQHNETRFVQNIHGSSASPADIKAATKGGIGHAHRVAHDALVQTAG